MLHRLDHYWSQVKEDQYSYEQRMRQDSNKYLSRWLDELREEKKIIEARKTLNDDAEFRSFQKIFVMNFSIAIFGGLFWLLSFVLEVDTANTMLFYLFLYLALNLSEFALRDNLLPGSIIGFFAVLCVGHCSYIGVTTTQGFENGVWCLISVSLLPFVVYERFCVFLWARAKKETVNLVEQEKQNRKSIEWGTKRLATNNRIDNLFRVSNN